MRERYEQILTDINLSLNDGYSVNNLHPEDRAKIDGYIIGILDLESALHNAEFDEERMIGKLQHEISKDFYHHAYNFMLGSAEYMIYGMIDGYSENQ